MLGIDLKALLVSKTIRNNPFYHSFALFHRKWQTLKVPHPCSGRNPAGRPGQENYTVRDHVGHHRERRDGRRNFKIGIRVVETMFQT